MTMATTSNHKTAFRAYRKHVHQNALSVTTEVAGDLAEKVIVRTPELTSRARANWDSELNTVPQDFDETRRDPGGQNSIRRAKEAIRQMKLGDVFVVANSAPYIGILERGYSKKAPLGFVAITAAEFPRIVERAVKRAAGSRA